MENGVNTGVNEDGEGARYWLTGASSGIGRALALLLAERGHRVYISARNEAALEELAERHPGRLLPLPVDVSDDAAMARPFAALPEARRPAFLDGILLCAGACEYTDLPILETASFRRVAGVNYFGVVNACAAALPLLREARARGRARPVIVGICSMSVYTAFPRAEAYGASKAAMRYFLEALRCDLQPEVAVTVVCPGFVRTPMTRANDFPMPFALSAEGAARRIAAALDGRRRNVAFPWQLHLLLKLAQWCQGLWFGFVVRRLRRQGGQGGKREQGGGDAQH